jgi:DUF1680 family protein
VDLTRRKFVSTTACTGLGLAATSWPALTAMAATPASLPVPDANGERIALPLGSFYRPYFSRSSEKADVTTWAQVDLGSREPIDAVKLYPASPYPHGNNNGFPVRFQIECADEPSFRAPKPIADRTANDYPDPQDSVVEFPCQGVQGRYVRVTVSRLRNSSAAPKKYQFGMAKIDVMSGGKDIAARCPVTADPTFANPDDLQQLTRPARPMGEGIVTNNPQNVTPPDSWHPPTAHVRVPVGGVTLHGGVFQKAMEENIAYLLDSHSVDRLLRQFRVRAGKPISPDLPKPDKFWEEDLAGSNAGRFLMGAANTMRWIDHPELRARVQAVVDGIAECRQPNGYIMAYPEDTIFYSERAAYTRAWLTHGLIEAGYAGNAKAFELLRGYYDWYNRQTAILPELMRGSKQGGQGMVANTRMYFTPAGKPADVQVIQRYFQENYWLDGLARRSAEAVWQYPYDRPHCYLLTNVEAYADLYRATGDVRYRDAAMGAWDLYHENWENTGGSISIIEFETNSPKSNFLYQKLGENCGSAFWALLNQRFHLLQPDEERYVAEIEKSIYNVLIADLAGVQGIRYHTMLMGQKEAPTRKNTCCEGQGTRLIGALPEFIYSIAPDGIYVNLFEASTINWTQSGQKLQLTMKTEFPFRPEVRIEVGAARPVKSKIRVRVPCWASGAVRIAVNGISAGLGTPGSYLTLDREWAGGDAITFTLPMSFRFTPYTGADQVAGRERFAMEFGPLLMASVGPADGELVVRGVSGITELATRFRSVPDHPLRYTLGQMEIMPYFQVADESFSCFPLISAKG